jgi:hypothetical protein
MCDYKMRKGIIIKEKKFLELGTPNAERKARAKAQ